MDPRTVFARVFGAESWIAVAVFGAVCLAIVVAVVLSARRKHRDAPPARRAEWTSLEVVYGCAVAAVAVVVIVLSIHTNDEEQTGTDRGAAEISITGFQWCWQFGYPGHHVTVNGQCQKGQLPTMVVPVGEPVTLSITSQDVIHSWFVPALRYKMDAFPDHVNRVTLVVDHAGRWIGRCAEFCGPNHATMDFYLEAVSPARYRQWLSSGGTTPA